MAVFGVACVFGCGWGVRQSGLVVVDGCSCGEGIRCTRGGARAEHCGLDPASRRCGHRCGSDASCPGSSWGAAVSSGFGCCGWCGCLVGVGGVGVCDRRPDAGWSPGCGCVDGWFCGSSCCGGCGGVGRSCWGARAGHELGCGGRCGGWVFGGRVGACGRRRPVGACGRRRLFGGASVPVGGAILRWARRCLWAAAILRWARRCRWAAAILRWARRCRWAAAILRWVLRCRWGAVGLARTTRLELVVMIPRSVLRAAASTMRARMGTGACRRSSRRLLFRVCLLLLRLARMGLGIRARLCVWARLGTGRGLFRRTLLLLTLLRTRRRRRRRRCRARLRGRVGRGRLRLMLCSRCRRLRRRRRLMRRI